MIKRVSANVGLALALTTATLWGAQAQDQGAIMDRVAKIESFLEYLESDNPLVRRAAIEEGIASDDRMMREAAIKAGFQSSDLAVKKEAMIAVLKTQKSWLVELDDSSITSQGDRTCARRIDKSTMKLGDDLYDVSEFRMIKDRNNRFTCRVLSDDVICTGVNGYFYELATRPDGAFSGLYGNAAKGCEVGFQLRNF